MKRFFDPYSKVLERFNRAKVRYVVVGMSGINYYASSAKEIFVTHDYDVFVKPVIENVKKAVSTLKALSYTVIVDGKELESSMIQRYIAARKTFLAVDPHGITIELILAVSGFVFNEMESDASIFELGKTPIRVAKLRKLLESKKIAGREKDKLFLKRYKILLTEK